MQLLDKRYILFMLMIVSVLMSVTAREYGVKDVPNVHVANRTRFLSNPDGLISPAAQAMADSIMADVWRRTSAEVTAVAVESIGNADANQFATELFEEWKIGKKDRDNGVLVLIVNDTHDIVIRTGYGVEGALPDITGGRIIRDYMIPAFRQQGLDAGLLSGLQMVHDVLTDPEVADELKSSIANDAGARQGDAESLGDMMKGLVMWGVFLAIAMIIVTIVVSLQAKKQPLQKRYEMLNNLTLWTLIATVMGIGLPIIAWLIARSLRDKTRHTAPECDGCGGKMKLLPPGEGTEVLSPQQVTETRIGSMTHDMWQCPNDGRMKVMSYPGPNYRNYTKCNVCGAHAVHLKRSYTTRKPTQFRAGEGMHEYVCEHCGNITRNPYSIAKLIPPVILGGFGGGRGFGGGGGFSGGSFGGGMTGGGGASGRW